MKKNFLCALALSSAAWASQAQIGFDTAALMKGVAPKDMITPLPRVSWLSNEHYLVASPGSPIQKVNAATGQAELYAQAPLAKPTQTVITYKNNDLYAEMPGAEVAQRLTNNPDEEKNATLSPNEKLVAFTRNNDLYCINLATLQETRLTHDGTKTLLNGFATWVYYEEIFGRATRYRAFWWSPNSSTIAYMRFDESQIPMFPLYMADGVHGQLEETRYPKVGDPNPAVKLGFINAAGGPTTWVDFGETTNHQLGWPKFTPNGDALFVQWQNRGQDSLRLYAVNPANGAKKEVYAETQKTWIDLSEADARLTFLNDGKRMLLQSDKTGWNHLYLYTIEGKLLQTVTSGSYRVTDVKHIDEKNQRLYFTARQKATSAQTHLYSIGLDGKNLRQLTPDGFNHNVTLSPDARYFTSQYSNVSTPPAVALMDMEGSLVRQIASAKAQNFDQYQRPRTEMLRITSADGKFELPAVVTWPLNMEPGKTYPMLISIYGGPDAGTVMNNWVWSATRQWYAQQGMIQVAFDHRASGHFGKEGVNYMHRNLGYWEMEDYKTMAQWFIKNGQANPAKVCITGFSYGGYMSCYALTYGADVFTHGMAGGSVVDWNLYDSHYTERYMDLPSENAEGYKKSSVFPYVNRYKGMLQVVHGTMDDNVHMQNSLQLIGALQDAKKPFEFMLYPNGRHGWRNLPARNDHYDNLKTTFIYQHLLEKPVPQGLLK
ncbi:MAG: S9 family peptidase [Bacteroidetes bacterium]|nr:MAG: S9 family peptidase [Bacteroidota bacterium]